MFDKKKIVSYTDQKHERRRLLRIVLIVLALYVLYNSANTFLFSVWVLQNDTMQPGLHSGDRFLVSSSALPSLFSGVKRGERYFPFKRGQIVLIDAGHMEYRRKPALIVEGFVRFFTAQRISLFRNEGRWYLKRIIGLPGDEISMTNFVLRVKPAGESYTLTEFELSEKPYYPNIPQVPALWDESIPFSGNMDTITLGSDECFVVSDDRSSTSDSRTWRAVSPEMIIGRALFRFWPLTRIGRP
jgi:signal peptidase I